MTVDPLAAVLAQAVAGTFPEPDGGFTVVPPDATTGLDAVLSFTGHAVIATSLDRAELVALGFDGLGGAFAPDALRGLAGPGGWIGVVDVSLVALGTGAGPGGLVLTDRHDDAHRVQYAQRVRADVQVLAGEHGFVTIGRGLGGRLELGFEVAEATRGAGHGRRLLADALGALAHGEPLFAACAPGNARSLRCLLAAGFVPIGAEVLVRPQR